MLIINPGVVVCYNDRNNLGTIIRRVIYDGEMLYDIRNVVTNEVESVPGHRIDMVQVYETDETSNWMMYDILKDEIECIDMDTRISFAAYESLKKLKNNGIKGMLGKNPLEGKIFATPCPTINMNIIPVIPVQEYLTELEKQYVPMDIKICDEVMKEIVKDNIICEVRNMFKNIKVNNFETMIHSDSENVECRLEFSTSFENAAELRNAFDKIHDPYIADAIAYGINDCLRKHGARNSGRYPWGNASGVKFQDKYYKTNGLPVPKKVIFNGPATVVLWTDNTKTVVKKSEGEPDDREKAIMYAIFKKFLDDKKRDMDRYLKLFYKVLEEDKKDEKKEN